MKKNLLWMLAAILTCGLMMTSCSSDDNPVGGDSASNGKKLTILYYANGGSDLDVYLLNNIRDMYLAGDNSVYDQINICVQYKNTAIFEVDKEKGYNEQYFLKLIEQVLPGFELEKGTTYRFLLDPAKGYSKEKPQMQLTDDNIYGGRGNKVNMGDENTLLDFINWAKENYPVENYMLIMNDHGGGYMRWTDSDNPKAPSYDDNTLTETAELIKGAPAIKAFVDQLCDSYTNGTDSLRAYVDAVTENAFKVNKELPYYDISDYLGRIYQNEKIEKEHRCQLPPGLLSIAGSGRNVLYDVG